MAGLKFRVLLDSEQNQEIFRDIVIDKDATFETFYNTIIQSFSFAGDQMASFYVSNDDWDKGHEISWMDMTYGEDEEVEAPSVMSKAKLFEHIEEADQKFILVYDFLRMWIFLIELIGYEKESPESPLVALSVGMAPPEDSRMLSSEAFEGEEMENEDDDFGFDDFDDGMNEEDFGNIDDYDF